jgi:hypothetical protein
VDPGDNKIRLKLRVDEAMAAYLAVPRLLALACSIQFPGYGIWFVNSDTAIRDSLKNAELVWIYAIHESPTTLAFPEDCG